MKRSILFLSILGAVSTNALAELPTMLGTVVVSATRSEQPTVPTPASITVISEQEIAQSGARNVAELLRGRAGIQVRDLYGDGSGGAIFDMRGFGPTAISNTLIMVDGRRLNSASDMNTPDITTITLKNIERIEIIQGSAGTLFGNQAVGGVINIITRTPQEFHADVDLSLGSYNSRSLTASLSNRLDNGISYRLAAEKRESDNYRDNNEVDYQNLMGRVDYEYTTGRVFAELHGTDEDLETPGPLYTNEMKADRRQSHSAYANDSQDTHTSFGRIGLSHSLSNNWYFDAELSIKDADRDYTLGSRTMGTTLGEQTREVITLTPRFVGMVPMNGGEAQFTIGSDIEITDYNNETNNPTAAYTKSTSVDQRIYAYYLQGVLPIDDMWSITAGARRALVRNHITEDTTFGSNFSNGENLDDEVTVGTFGLVFKPNESWRLFARADENFRFAKVDEHTSVYTSASGVENQTGISYELGGEWQGEHGRFKATAYRLNLKNEISYDAAAFMNVNLDTTKRKGLILEASRQLNQNTQVGFNYSYVDAEITSGSHEGSRVPLVAEHSASVLLDYYPMQALSLHAEVKYVGDRVLDSDYNNTHDLLDSYTVVNLSGEYVIDGWGIGLKVNNLFDKEYSEFGVAAGTQDAFHPSPERNFWLTVGYDFY
jgi:iron complex outermembrane receptor protein